MNDDPKVTVPSDEELAALTYRIIPACANCLDTGHIPNDQKTKYRKDCACGAGARLRRSEDRAKALLNLTQVRDRTRKAILNETILICHCEKCSLERMESHAKRD